MARKLSRQGERALDAANEIARKGLEVVGEERLVLARQALATSPLCAEAHMLFAAEAEEGSDEALAHWRRAATTSATALGPAGLRDLAAGRLEGDHVDIYVAAQEGLARALWRRGERNEAVEILTRAVLYDPADEFAAFFTLIGWLLAMGATRTAAAILHGPRGQPDSPEWAWAVLLIDFCLEGDTEATRIARQQAVDLAPKAARVLIRGAVPEDAFPPGTSPFDPERMDFDEAELVLEQLGEAWRETPGALAWLAPALEGHVEE